MTYRLTDIQCIYKREWLHCEGEEKLNCDPSGQQESTPVEKKKKSSIHGSNLSNWGAMMICPIITA